MLFSLRMKLKQIIQKITPQRQRIVLQPSTPSNSISIPQLGQHLYLGNFIFFFLMNTPDKSFNILALGSPPQSSFPQRKESLTNFHLFKQCLQYSLLFFKISHPKQENRFVLILETSQKHLHVAHWRISLNLAIRFSLIFLSSSASEAWGNNNIFLISPKSLMFYQRFFFKNRKIWK